MATTATTITLAGSPFPYIGIGVPSAQYITFIPSAELVFTTDESITVAGAGEDQSVQITCDLPSSFCYVLVESFCRISGLDAADWDQVLRANFNEMTGGNGLSIPLCYVNQKLGHDTTTVLYRDYRLNPPPTKLLIPDAVDSAFFRIEGFNPTIDGTVMTIKFYARFLRYDRNQSQFWQVNTPVLTR